MLIIPSFARYWVDMRASTGHEATGFPRGIYRRNCLPLCADKESRLPRNTEMDIPNLEVVTLSGERLSLKEDLQEAVRLLEENGCLVLKGATDLSPV
jgi:hypothetical protein